MLITPFICIISVINGFANIHKKNDMTQKIAPHMVCEAIFEVVNKPYFNSPKIRGPGILSVSIVLT